MKKISKILSVFGVLASSTSICFADIAVIVNPDSPLNAASQDQITRLFLGKDAQINGVTLVPVDLHSKIPAKNTFYEKVINKTPVQLNAYWARMIFTGSGSPPEQVSDPMEMLDTISMEPDRIGYISTDDLNDDVKVIFKVGE